MISGIWNARGAFSPPTRSRNRVFGGGAVVVGLLVAGCSTAASRDDFVQRFIETNADASTEQSECVVDELIRQYSLSGLERELEAAPQATAFERAQFTAMFGCGMTEDVEAELARQLANTGVEGAGAACAAEALTADLDDDDLQVLLSGEITDGFYAKYFVALEECGALP